MASSVRGPRWWWFPAVVLAVAPCSKHSPGRGASTFPPRPFVGDWKQTQAVFAKAAPLRQYGRSMAEVATPPGHPKR